PLYYPLSKLPPVWRELAQLLPATYAALLVQGTLDLGPSAAGNLAVAAGLLVLSTAVGLVVAWRLYQWRERWRVWATPPCYASLASFVTAVAIAVPTSLHFAVPPRSYVRVFPVLRTVSTALSTTAAASRNALSRFRLPSQSSSRWTARTIAIGFTSSLPACFGALPWIGSNIACSSPMFAPAAMPRPPWRTAARSVAMSPNTFVVTATSYASGDRRSHC